MQQPTPQAPPVFVDEAVRALAAVEPPQRPLSYGDIGSLRYGLLDMHGITDSVAVRAGAHDQLLERLIPDLAAGALELARASMDRLTADSTSNQAPVVLYSDAADIRRIVGQTLFWADHYLTVDHIAAAAAAGRNASRFYRGAVADLLELRPLVEAGIVVLVFIDLAVALIDTEVDKMVAVDLADPEYVAWAERQVVIEGPTAREAAFVHVVDDYPHHDWFYLHGHTDTAASQADAESARVSNRLLNRYDPSFDYGPWLATVRRQAVARLTQVLDTDLAVSAGFGADLVTASPFRARALHRRRPTQSRSGDYDVSGAVWANVPWLPDVSAQLLVKIASSEPRVDELRRATAKALRTVEKGDVTGSASAIADVGGDLKAAALQLGRSLRKQGSLDLTLTTGLAAGSVLVAGTFAPPLALSAILAGSAAAIPAARARLASRRTAAYAFWMARSR